MISTVIVHAAVGAFCFAALVLWIWAFRQLARDTTFSEGSKRAWFWVVVLGPIGGSIAYLSAKKWVAKYSEADPARLGRLLEKD